MTHRKEIEHRIKVMQAWLDGKEVQIRLFNTSRGDEWKDVHDPSFLFHTYEYRIKPRDPERLFILGPSEAPVFAHGRSREEMEQLYPGKVREFVEVIPEEE